MILEIIIIAIIVFLVARAIGNEKQVKEIPKPIDNKRRNFRMDEISYVFRKYNNKCVKCNGIDDLTIDHIIPLTKGGTNDLDNLQPLCRICNSKKGKR